MFVKGLGIRACDPASQIWDPGSNSYADADGFCDPGFTIKVDVTGTPVPVKPPLPLEGNFSIGLIILAFVAATALASDRGGGYRRR